MIPSCSPTTRPIRWRPRPIPAAVSIPFQSPVAFRSYAHWYRTEQYRHPSVSVFHSVLAREGDGQAVERQREGSELHAALGLGRGPPVLGGEVVEEDEHLQLGELVARARVGPVPERHERVGLGSHLQTTKASLLVRRHVVLVVLAKQGRGRKKAKLVDDRMSATGSTN
jgi:hypothetical protein